MPTLNFNKVIYGFHYYEPDSFTHNHTTVFNKVPSNVLKSINKDMEDLIYFSNKNGVPVIINEMGLYGPVYDQNGDLEAGLREDVRAEYVSEVISKIYDQAIGLTWWALYDNNTPYKKISEDGKSLRTYEVDTALWKALKLEVKWNGGDSLKTNP